MRIPLLILWKTQFHVTNGNLNSRRNDQAEWNIGKLRNSTVPDQNSKQ